MVSALTEKQKSNACCIIMRRSVLVALQEFAMTEHSAAV